MNKVSIYNPLEMMERILSNNLKTIENPGHIVEEKDDSFFAEFLLPGYQQKDISVEVSDNILILEGKSDDSHWTSDFTKKYKIPSSVNSSKIEAKLENGILKLKLPKRKESVSKRIEIF
jgi:HSP20 family protein